MNVASAAPSNWLPWTIRLKDGVGPNESLLSIAKAQRVLGYQPQYGWRDQREEA